MQTGDYTADGGETGDTREFYRFPSCLWQLPLHCVVAPRVAARRLEADPQILQLSWIMILAGAAIGSITMQLLERHKQANGLLDEYFPVWDGPLDALFTFAGIILMHPILRWVWSRLFGFGSSLRDQNLLSVLTLFLAFNVIFDIVFSATDAALVSHVAGSADASFARYEALSLNLLWLSLIPMLIIPALYFRLIFDTGFLKPVFALLTGLIAWFAPIAVTAILYMVWVHGWEF